MVKDILMLFSSELRDLFYSMHIYSVKSETHSASGWLIAILDVSYHRSLWRVRNLICQPRGRKKGQVQKSEAILPFFMVDQKFCGWSNIYFHSVLFSKKVSKSLSFNFSTKNKKLRDSNLVHFLRMGTKFKYLVRLPQLPVLD